MRATRTVRLSAYKTAQHYAPEKPRVATHDNQPEMRIGSILTKYKLRTFNQQPVDVYTATGKVTLYPDHLAVRKKGTPNIVAIYLHGVKWHRGKERRMSEHRAVLEAAKNHVLEIAFGSTNSERFWEQVEEVIRRVCVEGENIKFAGTIEDLMSLSFLEGEQTVIIK